MDNLRDELNNIFLTHDILTDEIPSDASETWKISIWLYDLLNSYIDKTSKESMIKKYNITESEFDDAMEDIASHQADIFFEHNNRMDDK